MKRLLLFSLPLLALLGLTPAQGQTPESYVLQIDMRGENMVPPVETHAWGFVRFFFNADRTEAEYTVDLKGYSNTSVTGAAIHRGARGENGPVLFELAGGGFIVTAGHLSLTPEQVREFASGNWYVSLTTVFHPEGEIRGQIVAPPGFLPGTSVAPPPTQPAAPSQPQPQATPVPGSIQPPNTGDAGLR